MKTILSLQEDGSGTIGKTEFDYMSRRAQRALAGPVELNGPPLPQEHSLDIAESLRFFVVNREGERVLDWE